MTESEELFPNTKENSNPSQPTSDLDARKYLIASATPQESMFCYKYMESYDYKLAAQHVGLPASDGMKMLRNPVVQAIIASLQDEMQERSVIDADYVRYKFIELIPKLEGKEEVPLIDKDCNSFMGRKFQPNELIKVLVELAKSTKFYENGSKADLPSNFTFNVSMNEEKQ